MQAGGAAAAKDSDERHPGIARHHFEIAVKELELCLRMVAAMIRFTFSEEIRLYVCKYVYIYI